jgi:hypothetical protein
VTEVKRSSLASILAKHLLSVAGGVVTLAGLLPLLTSSSLKAWLKIHSYLVFVVLILVVTAACIIVDVILSKKRSEATEHDRRIVSKFLERLPPDGQTIVWLKESFISKSVPIKYVDKLDALTHEMKLNVIGLDNPQADQAYIMLRNTTLHFLELVSFDLFSNPDYTALQNSPDWTREDWMAASARINQARDDLVKAYDEFVRVCHKNSLDLVLRQRRDARATRRSD